MFKSAPHVLRSNKARVEPIYAVNEADKGEPVDASFGRLDAGGRAC